MSGSVPTLIVVVDWSAMEQLQVPVLLLTGEADLYAPPPLQRMIAAHLRRHEMVTLREVGHAPYWEVPAEFNRLVLNFLGRNPDSSFSAKCARRNASG